ncbi:MAG TPA: hypothetical protein VFU55_11595 [Terracidiphilus sp.]|nr:hypothetical protein [Terracidiphilus sp.]
MVLLIVGTVFLGFARTYYLAPIYHTHVRNLLIGVHGAVFSTWIVLLVVQTTLVARRNIALHRRLGIFGAGLAVTMVGLGVAAATDSLALGFTPPGFPFGPVVFYCISISNISKFAVLIFFAIWLRSNGPAHKRLVLLATLALMGAAIDRWHTFIHAHFGTNVILDLMVLSIVVFDLSTIRRIHRATLLGGLFFIVTGALAVPIARTAGWHKFATFALHVRAHLG